MLVSIIICTFNNAESLRLTLQAFERMEIPEGHSVELVVVDNGSTDATPSVVQQANLSNMAVRSVREERRGQCHARNRGLAETVGQIVLFTDDDVRPPTNWIRAMCAPILSGEADAVAGGIRVAPHLRRRWLIEGFPGFCASREPHELTADGLLIGANMGFARRVFQRVPQFDVALDPGALGFAGDSLLSMQLVEAGYRIAAVRDATVDHHFDADRLQAASVMETARKMGRSEAYLHYHWRQGTLFSWQWRREAWLSAIYLLNRLVRPARWACTENPPYWKLHPVIAYWFVKQYLIERKGPRVYAR